jgi:hypothetical protein
VVRSPSVKTIPLRTSAYLMKERIRDGLVERLAGVRYFLASHPAINSVRHLQPEVIRIRIHAGRFPWRSNLE